MLLSNDKDLFYELIRTIAEEQNILEQYIEKDFYALSILKELVSRNDKFVFKGGTSLSVCQKAINRFSEDIDISYEDEIITVGTRKRIKKIFFESIEAVSLSVSNAENIRSRRIFNRYLCPYTSLWNKDGDDGKGAPYSPPRQVSTETEFDTKQECDGPGSRQTTSTLMGEGWRAVRGSLSGCLRMQF